MKSENKITQKVSFKPDVILKHKEVIKTIADCFMMQRQNENYNFDTDNKDIIIQLIKYFLNAEDCEYNLQKGLMLVGNTGTGKTLIMEIFKKYCEYLKLDKNFNIAASRMVVREYSKNGFNGLEKYSYNLKQNTHGIAIKHMVNYCFDDIGIENNNTKHFGTDENVINELLLDRYELFKEGILTHITTNLDGNNLKEKYKDRLNSRFREMFNFIELSGKDRRK